jgi:hypothetical protein
MNRATLRASMEFLDEIGICDYEDYEEAAYFLRLAEIGLTVIDHAVEPNHVVRYTVEGDGLPDGEPDIILEYEVINDGPRLTGWHV